MRISTYVDFTVSSLDLWLENYLLSLPLRSISHRKKEKNYQQDDIYIGENDMYSICSVCAERRILHCRKRTRNDIK